MIKISVIIPTYNRVEILQMTLSALSLQTISKRQFEVIIIDDGSKEEELKSITSLVKKQKFSTILLQQEHRGPAAARNKGIKAASGDIVLIINDDTVPSDKLLERHIHFHNLHYKENFGLLGMVTWHPQIEITPFMRWLENGGPYFSFNSIPGKIAGWQRLWTCNVSFKRSFLLNHGIFDESFPDAAWEDIELGYRLSRHGLALHYDKDALGYHYHPTSITSIKNKMKSNGRNLTLIREKLPRKYWPPLAKNPKLFILLDKLACLGLLSRIVDFCPSIFDQLSFGKMFDLILLHHRISGLSERYS